MTWFEPAVMTEGGAAICALYCGVVLGMLYDLFRLLHLPFSNPWAAGVIDALYYAAALIVTWGFMLYINCGTLRVYIFVFIGLGLLLYTRFAGRLIREVAARIKAKFTKKELHR